MEAWLPTAANWSGRIRADVPGSVMGGPGVTSTSALGSAALAQYAADYKSATVTTDGGHSDSTNGFYLTNPDGTPNTTGWSELSQGSVHQMASNMKALVSAYYAKAADKTYAYGCSSGGRAVMQEAQMYAGDFDGILAEATSIDQTQLFPANDWGHIVMQRDLADNGLPLLTLDQRNTVSLAAVNACDGAVNGQHDGFITDYEQCKYDPRRMPACSVHPMAGQARRLLA